MKNILLIAGLAAAISLSACAYQSDLDKKLQGKERAEKQLILANECRKESRPPTVNSEQGQKRMDELCNSMIKEMNSQDSAPMQTLSMREMSAQTLKATIHDGSNLQVGKKANVVFSLERFSDGQKITLDDLKETHTTKLHVLIVDPTLTDYRHVHPVADSNGDFVFSFVPQKPGDYRIWADVIPVATNKEEYVITDLKSVKATTGTIDRKVNNSVTVNGLTFDLKFDTPPKAGAMAMGSVIITKNGRPFTQLEPIMGAYAHIVGINEDRKTIAHIHPMGNEPADALARGGPELPFHIEPEKSGFTRLFVQVRVKGQDLFAPFGLNID